MRSMTGFGAASMAGLHVELRSLNHRHLELRASYPQAVQARLRLEIERTIRETLERGRIELTMRVEGASAPRITVSKEVAREVYQQLEELSEELRLPRPRIEALVPLPGLIASADTDQHQEIASEDALSVVNAACQTLLESREREGAKLCRDFRSRLDLLSRHAAALHEGLPHYARDLQNKAAAQLTQMLKLDIASKRLEKGQLEASIAAYVLKHDFAEEVIRLSAHLEAAEQLLTAEASRLGRRFEFLLQEMQREVSTLGAKATDLAVTRRTLDMKVELERMREQIQNVL